MTSRTATAICAWLLLFHTVQAGVFDAAVTAKDVDYQNTGTFVGQAAKKAKPKDLSPVLDPRSTVGTWSADGPPNWQTRTFRYRLAFQKPVAVGTMLARVRLQYGKNPRFHYLKPGATYPGDPAREADWVEIPASFLERDGVHSFTFPPGFKTRAFLFAEDRYLGPSAILEWHLLETRLHDIAPTCVGQGEMTDGALDPMLVPRGIRSWHSGGPTWPDDKIHRVPVTSVAPSWYIMTRKTPFQPVAMRLRCNATDIKFYAYKGPANANPALAPKKDWRRIKPTLVSETKFPLRGGDNRRVFSVDEPLRTRALKVMMLETSPRNSQIAALNEWALWEDLGAADVPPARQDVPAPVSVEYQVERDAEVALALDDEDGVRTRNLIAQVGRVAGPNAEPWDLKDEDGFYVQPDTYKLKGIYAPPLELVYQHTYYPSVEMHSPESRPWPRGSKDGWLANHANHTAVCAVGDRLYISAGGTEGGDALAEIDFSGQKQWGSRHGASRMATDGDSLYLHGGTFISKLDPKTRKIKRLLSYHDNERKGTLTGMAAHGGEIVLAIHGKTPYFQDAAHAGRVDMEACLPKLPKSSSPRSRSYYNIPAYPQADFLRLFRLQGDPAGLDAVGSLTYIPSTDWRSHKQYVVLAFKEPLPIGSVVFPALVTDEYSMQLSVLKPDASYPPNPKKQSDWIPFEKSSETAWEVLAAPPDTTTRAFRITFLKKGEDGLMDDFDESMQEGGEFGLDAEDEDDVLGGLVQGTQWQARLEGMRILRRRFKNLFPTARIRVNSGEVNEETGEWDGQRKRVIWTDDPGVYVLEWDDPQTVHGLAIKEIDGMKTFVDVYVGPDNAPVDIDEFAQDENTGKKWKCVGLHRQKLRTSSMPSANRNVLARYMDGFVNFGKGYKTRAVRLRVSEQWRAMRGSRRKDQGGAVINTRRCHVYGVAPLQYIGGEPTVDPLAGQRLAVYNTDTGDLLRALPSTIDGDLAFDPAGQLFGISDRRVLEVDSRTGETGREVVDDVLHPRLVEFDRHGRLYVYDHEDNRRVVRVYDAKRKYLHSIGTPGPKKAGPWDPASLGEISAMSVDGQDGIWMIYPHENPRRTIHFKTDGTFVKEMLGNTPYGGGGTLDRYDRTRAYFKDVVFNIDWGKTDTDRVTSRIDSMMSMNLWESSQYAPLFRQEMVPIMVNNRRYMVNIPLLMQPRHQAGYVYLYDEEKKTMRMVAGVGSCTVGSFFDQDPAMIRHLDGEPLKNLLFIWGDRNGDGKMQVPEVQFEKTPKDYYGLGRFDRDLGVMGGKTRYEVKKFLADGTPIYHKVPVKAPGGFYRMDNGNYLSFTARGKGEFPWCIASHTPRGKRMWTYWASQGVSGLFIPPWVPGQISNLFTIIGHEKAHAGDLGEFVVIHANTGQWTVWTADGMLAGRIMNHARDPKARRLGSEYARGTRLDGLTAGQEHFHGFFCKTVEDDRYYIVTGGNHASIVEVKGLEKFRRFEKEITITPDMLSRTRVWEANRLQESVLARSPTVECLEQTPRIDGKVGLTEWGDEGVEIRFQTFFNAAHDRRNLYLCWKVMRSGPLRVSGKDFRRFFRSGGAVDLRIGTDPDADVHRTKPAKGDIRLLITTTDDKPVAVLYQPVAPDAPPDHAWEVSTFAGGTVTFDQVKILDEAVVRLSGGDNYYEVEVAIPLTALGLVPREGMVLRLDTGVLCTDKGKKTTDRYYWADKMAVGLPDEATETRLRPSLWGFIRFAGRKKTQLEQILDADPDEPDTDIEDLMDGLEDGLL